MEKEEVKQMELIDRQAAADLLRMAIIDGWEPEYAEDKLKALPTVQAEPLTDYEQRIFLAAMGKERAVCKKLTDEWDGMKLDVPCQVNLLRLCAEIERKVKAALWTN